MDMSGEDVVCDHSDGEESGAVRLYILSSNDAKLVSYIR